MSDAEAPRKRQAQLGIPLTDSGEEDSWLITYLDTITLLLVMFVVMLALSDGKGPGDGPGDDSGADNQSEGLLLHDSGPAAIALGQPEPGPQVSTPTTTPLVDQSLLSGLSDDVEVVYEEGKVSFRISSEILFASAGAELEDGGYRALDPLIPILQSSPHTVAVAGHTDNLPINTARFPSNWELSAARAGSVIRYLIESGVDPARLRAEGYADTRPLTANDSDKSRAQNRRVELTLESQP